MGISAQERMAFLKLGGACAVLGGLGYILSGAIHQALPSGPSDAVPHVAHRPEWYAIHLLAMLSVAMWPVAFAALIDSLSDVWSRVIGRIAVGAMVVGLVLFVIEMSLDGHVLKNVADAWATASSADQEEQFLIAQSVYAVLQGNFAVSVLWTTGIPFVLIGIALSRSGKYPAWLGWMGTILGLIITAFGINYYLRLGWIPQIFGHVLPSFLLGIWLVVLGIIMFRKDTSDEYPD